MTNHFSIPAWRIPRMEDYSLVDYNPWGHKELDVTEQQISNRYCGDHFSMYTSFKSLCFMSETNTVSYVSYISIKTVKN